MSRDNLDTNEVRVDRARIISLDDSDPRYNLNIEDSDEYTRNIYPLHFSKRCHKSKEYQDMVKYDFPLVSRCWGERYEHCAVMKKYGKDCKNKNNPEGEDADADAVVGRPVIETGACSCAECAMNLYGPIEDTLGYARIDLSPNSSDTSYKEELNRSDFKEQNRSSIYDQTRIFKTDGLEINYRQPDTKVDGSNMSVNKAGNSLEYNLELEDKYAHLKPNALSDQNIEGFIGSIGSGILSGGGAVVGGVFESSLGLCLPQSVAEKWGYSTMCCVICGLLLCCMVSQAFITGGPFILKQPPIPSYIMIFACILICCCGSLTTSYFKS